MRTPSSRRGAADAPPVNFDVRQMQDQLRLEIRRDEDGTAELFATVQAGPFSGHSSAWFNQKKLVKFGQSIATSFPINGQISISGGFGRSCPGTWCRSTARKRLRRTVLSEPQQAAESGQYR
jgi:hypothetical protein